MRFTIRDLLWLTLLAAVAVAWWVDRQALAKRIDELERAAQAYMTNLGSTDLDLVLPAGSPSPVPELPP